MAVSLQASEYGLEIIDEARKDKGWFKSQEEWINGAEVSPASLRRFWLGQPIKRDSFVAICKAVDVDWRIITNSEPDPPTQTRQVITVMKYAMQEIFETAGDNNPALKIEAAKAYASLVMAQEAHRPESGAHAKNGATPAP